MGNTHYAAIDIGSNAVRLLIKRLEDASTGRFSKVTLLRVPLRLGQDAFSTGAISEKKARDLNKLIKSFAIVMDIYNIKEKNYRGCATAAMREATNGHHILSKIARETGLHIDIIPGEVEAAIVCSSHCDDKRTLLYVDVGGGSTEVSLISEGNIISTKSYAIGTIRMLNNAVDEYARLTLQHDMELIGLDYPNITIVGAGGNINKIFEIAQDRDAEAFRLSTQSLRKLHDEMHTMSIDERALHFNLKPDRADAIVPAAEIFLSICDATKATAIEVPATGLSDGIIDDIFRRQHTRS